MFDAVTKVTSNEQGFMQVGNLYSVCPEPLLIEKLKLKIRTKAEH
jgi:hypothetical protein